jgi:DNA modification methylase
VGRYQSFMTSPPYLGMRNYGVAPTRWTDNALCCLGDEGDPRAYAYHLASIFSALWRSLRSDGTIWLNVADTIRDGRLLRVPDRVCDAMEATGWELRSEVIWAKGTSGQRELEEQMHRTMVAEGVDLLTASRVIERLAPYEGRCLGENAPSRPVRTHERLFMFGKRGHAHYFDANAARTEGPSGGTRLLRSVWTLQTAPFKGAHTATFPEAFVRMALHGSVSPAVCAMCGAPLVRVWEKGAPVERQRKRAGVDTAGSYAGRETKDYTGAKAQVPGKVKASILAGMCERTCTGFQLVCGCQPMLPARPWVLDPFAGSGTVGRAARAMGFNVTLIDADPRNEALMRGVS